MTALELMKTPCEQALTGSRTEERESCDHIMRLGLEERLVESVAGRGGGEVEIVGAVVRRDTGLLSTDRGGRGVTALVLGIVALSRSFLGLERSGTIKAVGMMRGRRCRGDMRVA